MKAHLLGLTVACPYNLCNPVNCPLCDIRTLPMKERFQWVESLSIGEIESLLETHGSCLQKKLAADLSPSAGGVAAAGCAVT